jgi:NitT/TauT family transport system substrate-binding protein
MRGGAVRRLSLLIVSSAMLAAATSAHAASFLGRPGEPIRLAVGFNPYMAPSSTLGIVYGRGLWKRHLPPGSHVDLELGIRGPALADLLRSGALQIAYSGDPAVGLAADVASGVRLIAIAMLSQDSCVVVVRAGAPAFANPRDGARWLSGKRVASTRGTCQDRVLQLAMEREGVKPARYFELGRESLAEAFREHRIDAAGVPEPGASDLVLRGVARRLTSSRVYGEWDAGFIVASTKLLRERPDVVNGWLEAELEAQQFLADPRNADETVRLLARRARSVSERALRAGLYGAYPETQGGERVRAVFPFAFSAEAKTTVRSVYGYLQRSGFAPPGALRADAIDGGWTERILAAHKLEPPVGVLRAIDAAPGEAP